jgi:hypothetical protein
VFFENIPWSAAGQGQNRGRLFHPYKFQFVGLFDA